jgi:preprotein translocase subunit SecG
MDTVNLLKYFMVVDGGILIVLILIQARSGGLGTVFGGSVGGEFYRSKRGLETILHNGTIILSILFCIAAIAIAILSV